MSDQQEVLYDFPRGTIFTGLEARFQGHTVI